MVSTLRLAAIALFGLTVVGCAAEAAPRNETPVADDGKAPPVRSSTSSSETADGDDGTLPVTPVPTTTEDRLPPAQGGDEAAKPPKDPVTTPEPTAPAVKTLSCTARSGEHSSLSTVTFTVVDGVVKISKMTVLVTNKDQNDKNDADIFLKPKGGSETKAFWTDDVLASGKTVEVEKARALAPKAGAVMRIETNFDRTALTDPSADCEITFPQ